MAQVGRRVAAYQQVADDLLGRIEGGEFGPGDKLPTEAVLMDHYGISSTTARAAVRALALQGVVETRHGSGSYVVERRLLRINATHTEDLDRRRGIVAQDSWSTDVASAGRKPSQRFECLNVPAQDPAAGWLAVPLGDPLVMRRCWRSVDGVPASIEASVFPRWLVEALPALARPHDISQGTTSYVSENGFPMRVHQDFLSARPLSRDEEGFFAAPPGVSALIRLRVSFEQVGGRVLRVMTTVYRSDMHEVVYDVAGAGNLPHIPEPTPTEGGTNE